VADHRTLSIEAQCTRGRPGLRATATLRRKDRRGGVLCDAAGERAMDSTRAVIDALERAPEIVVPLVREVPSALLKRRPRSSKWSVHEHACHLAIVHRLFFDRLERMLSTPAPVITPYDPGQNDPEDTLLKLDLDAMLDRYVEDRLALVGRLRRLTPDDWHRTAEHGEYSHYSVFIMFRHLALHDFFHAYRIEELLLRKDWTAEWQSFAASASAG
jgi:hypothetical protein